MATRRERVVLELESNFATQAARDAAAIRLLNHEVKSLSGSAVSSRSASRDLGDGFERAGRSARSAGGDVEEFSRKSQRAEASIDKLSGRVRILADVAAILGPGLIPIGAVGIPAVAGLASQMGFAALAGGTMIGAFQGVGDALKAMNKAALEPTAENIAAAREAMQQISPAARAFVRELRQLEQPLKALRDVAAKGMFPGFTEGLDALSTRLPDVQRIVAAVAGELGDIGAAAGNSLASARWDDFFTFLADEAPRSLNDMAKATGNVVHAMAELWMAFQPLNNDFGSWLVSSTKGLDEWASKLSGTNGFQEFVDYIRSTGPQVEATFAAIGNAVLQIVEAAAPLGGPVLKGLEAVAKVIAAVADSDIGTPIFTALSALALYNRALALTGSLSKKAFGSEATSGLRAQVTGFAGIKTAYREAAAASQNLAKADAARAQAAIRARDAQFAMISPGAKRGAVTDFVAAGKTQAEAARRVVEAEKAKSAALREGAVTAGKAGAAVAALAVVTTGAADKIGLTNTATLGLAGSMAGPWGAAIGAGTGAVVDLTHANDGLDDSLTALRGSLRASDFSAFEGQVTSMQSKIDDLKKSTGVFDLLSDSAKLFGGVMSGRGWTDNAVIKSYERDLNKLVKTRDNNAAAAGREAAMSNVAAAGLTKMGAGAHDAAAGLKFAGLNAAAAANKIREIRKSAAETGNAFIGLGKGVNDAKLSLSGWLGELEAQNRALNAFADNSIKAANKGLRDGLIKQLQKAGPEGARRLDQLANGTQAAIGRANRAWVGGRQAIDKYQDAVSRATTGQVGKVNVFSSAIRSLPKKVQTQITQNGLERTRAAVVDLTRRYKLTPKQVSTLIREQGGRPTRAMVDGIIAAAKRLNGQRPNPKISARDGASGTINSVRRALDALNGHTAKTYIVTYRSSTGPVSQISGGGRTGNSRADGGAVYASDGQSRGPRDDSIPAWLSHREWVQPVAAVDFYGERFMEDVRNRRLPKPQGYADGGSVQRFAKGGSVKRKKAKPSPGRLTRAERVRANKQFDIGTIGLAATKRELDSFAKTINRSGGRVGRDFGRLSKQILANATQYERNTKAIAALKEKQTSAREAGVGAFNNNIYGGSAKDLLTQLEADRNDARSSAAAIAVARTRGLNGDLAAGLAGSGNAALAAEFAQMSASQIASYQSLYASRTSAQNSLGSQAAASYTNEINQLTQTNRQLTATLNKLEHAVERGAKNGVAGKKRATTTKHKARG